MYVYIYIYIYSIFLKLLLHFFKKKVDPSPLAVPPPTFISWIWSPGGAAPRSSGSPVPPRDPLGPVGSCLCRVADVFARAHAPISIPILMMTSMLFQSTGLSSSEAEAGALWIYPFAGGGFIYIALVSLIPDMMQDETSTMPWWRDVLHIMLGAVIVGTVTSFHDAFEHSEL